MPKHALMRLAIAALVALLVASASIASDAPPLTDYEGSYKLTPETDLKFFVRDGALHAESKFQPATALVRLSADSFAAESVGARFDFERNAQGRVIAVTMDQAEKVIRAERRSPG